MKVTITLGEKAIEYVTGIPEEELPEILSDVLERSLREQVKDISKGDTSNDQNDILSQLREILKGVSSNTSGTAEQDDSGFKEAIMEIVKPLGPIDLGDDDEFDLMK